jgi:hypothetical protein
VIEAAKSVYYLTQRGAGQRWRNAAAAGMGIWFSLAKVKPQ